MTLLPNDRNHFLRQRAEALQRGQPIQTSDLSDTEIQLLLREIQIQQLALQRQNEELNRANHELALLQKRYSALFDFTPVASLVVDQQDTIIEANVITVQMLRVDRKVLIGQSLLNFIVPADHAVYYTHQHGLHADGTIQRYILRVKRADGSVFRGRLHVAHAEAVPEAPASVRIAISDVTELYDVHESLRIAEERIKTILSVAPIGFFSQDLDLHFTWVYSSGAEGGEAKTLIGKTDFDILDDPEQARQLYEFKRRVLETEQGNRQIFAMLIQGTLQHWDIMAEPLYNPDGQLIGISGAAVNITAQKEGEQDRAQLQLERKKLHLMEGVLSETTHDLKAPLTAMISSLYLLQRVDTEEARQRHFERIEMLAMRLSKMVNDLSSILKLDQMRTVTTRVLDLGLLLTELIDEHRDMLNERQQGLKVSYPTSPCRILANESYFYRAISNILSNASQYTPPGGQIRLRLAQEGEEAVLQIEDTGIGIAPEELPHIFDRFFRSKRAREMSQTGTGLGLAIARRVLEVHDGNIAVTSEIGKGTQFTIRLPLFE